MIYPAIINWFDVKENRGQVLIKGKGVFNIELKHIKRFEKLIYGSTVLVEIDESCQLARNFIKIGS